MASKKQEEKDGAQKVPSESTDADQKCDQKAADEKCVEPRPDSESKGHRERPKTGEPRDNLKRRAEWFQKRH